MIQKLEILQKMIKYAMPVAKFNYSEPAFLHGFYHLDIGFNGNSVSVQIGGTDPNSFGVTKLPSEWDDGPEFVSENIDDTVSYIKTALCLDQAILEALNEAQ